MYLSRMELDVKNRRTMAALASPNLFHGAVESAFSGGRQRRLWRIDRLGERCYLLLLSGEKPDLNAAARQFGPAGLQPAWETRDYNPLLSRISAGGVWQFRLVANPTVSKSAPGSEETRGQVFAHITPAHQEAWLTSRAAGHGFAVRENEFQVLRSEWFSFRKGSDGRNVSFLAVSYEGLLTVTDADLFCRTLTVGMGRGKAYGMGLLTVVRAQG